jgi:hypothetical protein
MHPRKHEHSELKRMLRRIASMLTRLIDRADVVSESNEEFHAADEYEYRGAEYEYEREDESEPSRAPAMGLRTLSNGQSPFPAQ